jgi:AAA-like domain/Effector-associated domain 1
MHRTWTRDELLTLRAVLVELYRTGKAARRVVLDAGLDGQRFDFNDDARTMWFGIVEELIKNGDLAAVLAIAKSEYPQNRALSELLSNAAQPGARLPARQVLPRPLVLTQQSDPSVSGQRPGAAYSPDRYVARPRLEFAARSYLANAGLPLTLIGPSAMGKTWLSEHLLAEVRNTPGVRIARVNLLHISLDERGSFLAFAGAMLRVLGRALNLQEKADELAADARLVPVLRITELLESALDATTGIVHLMLDVPDEVLMWGGWHDIDGMLRSWHEQAAQTPWNRLRIILVLSTSPAIVTRSVLGSPFRLSPVHVGDFDTGEVNALARNYAVTLTPDDYDILAGIVGRHPMLLSAVLYGMSVDGLDARAACRLGSNPALRNAVQQAAPRLRDHPELVELLRAIARSPGCSVASSQRRDIEALESAGLVCVHDRGWALRLPVFEALL